MRNLQYTTVFLLEALLTNEYGLHQHSSSSVFEQEHSEYMNVNRIVCSLVSEGPNSQTAKSPSYPGINPRRADNALHLHHLILCLPNKSDLSSL